MQPLTSIQVIEFEGIGPGPMAGMLLADLGAKVTVIGRPGGIALRRALNSTGDGQTEMPDALARGKTRIDLNLKTHDGVAAALELVANADAIIEGNRPGVMERLGLGPEVFHAKNPRLVYARVTGWGQTGPLAPTAGHDLNYVALTGLLHLAGRPGALPKIPPTVLGDAVGALSTAFGIVSAVLAARQSGRGCVIDAAIVDAAAQLGQLALTVRAAGQLDGPNPSPFHDSPFYDCYQCADGKALTVGALEPQFYAILIEKLSTEGLTGVKPGRQYDSREWPQIKSQMQALFMTKPRDYWCGLFAGSDACVAPVLSVEEAVTYPHNAARKIFSEIGGVIQAAPAPRFSASSI
jgi:alpha-methylacyl-CoA racemase